MYKKLCCNHPAPTEEAQFNDDIDELVVTEVCKNCGAICSSCAMYGLC